MVFAQKKTTTKQKNNIQLIVISVSLQKCGYEFSSPQSRNSAEHVIYVCHDFPDPA